MQSRTPSKATCPHVPRLVVADPAACVGDRCAPAAHPAGTRRITTGSTILAGQTLLALLAIISLVAPQGKGMKMLVPLTPSAIRTLPAIVLATDRSARLVASGPLPGSIVVYSEALPLAKLIAMGVVSLDSPSGGCGAAGLAK